MKKLNLTRRVRTDWNNLRIRQRMLVSYILAILIPIVFINALTFVLTRNMALVTVSKAVDVTLANGNNTFNALFTGLYERAVATSNTRELASLFDETEVAPVSGSVPTLRLSETLSALSVIYETSPQYFYKFYAERENLSYYSGNLQIVNSFPDNLQDWYKKAIRFGDGVYWWDVHDDESFGFSRRFITACRTIKNKDVEALGLATVSLDFMRVGEAFINLMKPYQGMVYIFDSAGRPLFANRIDNKIAPLATLPADPLSDEIKTAAFSSAYGNGRIGSQVIFNYANVDQLMWKIVTVLPQDQFFGVTNTFWSFLVPVLLATILIFLIVTLRVSSNLSRPIEVLATSMLSADETAFPRSYLEREDEIGSLTRAYIRMVDRNAQLIDETKLINEKKRLFQLEALQRQIDSHFIHNTLNNIQWLATAGRNDDVISTATSLGKLLHSCATQKNELVTIEDELDYVDSYLNIQKIRFGNRFTYYYELNPLLLQMKIPMFVMQPIVENSIYHGLLDGNSDEGFIRIRIFLEDDHIIISIFDNGRGVPNDQLAQVISSGNNDQDRFMGIALKNIDMRLKLTFGDAYGLSITSREGDWTDVRIRIPIIEDNESQ